MVYIIVQHPLDKGPTEACHAVRNVRGAKLALEATGFARVVPERSVTKLTASLDAEIVMVAPVLRIIVEITVGAGDTVFVR